MKELHTSSELDRLLTNAGVVLSESDKQYLRKHFKHQLKQAFVHGIMSGPNGNFETYYEQKYGHPIKDDDHFGI